VHRGRCGSDLQFKQVAERKKYISFCTKPHPINERLACGKNKHPGQCGLWIPKRSPIPSATVHDHVLQTGYIEIPNSIPLTMAEQLRHLALNSCVTERYNNGYDMVDFDVCSEGFIDIDSENALATLIFYVNRILGEAYHFRQGWFFIYDSLQWS
jgi:hypothetical protein